MSLIFYSIKHILTLCSYNIQQANIGSSAPKQLCLSKFICITNPVKFPMYLWDQEFKATLYYIEILRGYSRSL